VRAFQWLQQTDVKKNEYRFAQKQLFKKDGKNKLFYGF
jgi:hypothetical protein